MHRKKIYWLCVGLIVGIGFWSVIANRPEIQRALLPASSFLIDDTLPSQQSVQQQALGFYQTSLWDTWNPKRWLQAAIEKMHGYFRSKLVEYLNTMFRGEIRIGKTAGSLIGGLTFYDLVLRYEDTAVVTVPILTVSYDLWQLVRGRVQVTQVQGFQPVLRLKQNAEGKWNILEAFTPATVEETQEKAEKGGFDIHLDKVAVRSADIEVTPKGQAVQTYRLAEADIDMQLDIVAAGVDARIQQLTTKVTGPNLPLLQVKSELAYQGTEKPARVDISQLSLDTTKSHLRVTGTIENLDTMQTQAKLVIDNLATTDVAQLVPQWPVKEDISGTAQVNGPLSELHTQLALSVAEAKLTGDIRADLSQETPHYQGTLTVAHFNTQKLLNRDDLAGVLDGTVHVSGVGTSFADLQGKVDMQARTLRVAEWQIGSVSLNGQIERQLAKLTGKLQSTVGQATWEGSLNLAETQPRYNLALSVTHLDVQKAVPGAEPVTTDLNLRGTVKGVGVALADLHAQTDITFAPSTVGKVKVESGRVDARVVNGRIHLDELTLNAKDTRVEMRGELGTTTEQSGQLTYAIRVADVSPWLALVDQQGTGTLALTGTAKGNFADLQVQGELKARDLNLADTAIRSGNVTFTLADLGQPAPHGVIEAQVQDVRGGVLLRTATAQVTVPQRQQAATLLTAHVNVQAQDVSARSHRMQGDITYQPEQLVARLTTLQLQAPDGMWNLAQPTRIIQNKGETVVEQLRMSNGKQNILIDGRAALSGAQNLRVQIDRFAIATLQPLLPPEPNIQGLLSGQAQISGTAAAPLVTSMLALTDMNIAGQKYAGLNASLDYQQQRASFALTFQQDATHALSATGTLPIAVSWVDGWKTQERGDLDMRVHSSGINLAFLNAFTGKAVQEVTGEFIVDMTLRGRPTSPIPQGSFQLRDGQARVNPLGVHIAAVTVGGRLDPEQIRIEEFSAKAADGQLSGSGTISLREYAPQQLSLSLSADRWPAIQTSQYHVLIDGRIEGRGPLDAPNITGRLRVPEAIIRPDLAVLQSEPLKRDETIVVISAKNTSPSGPELDSTVQKKAENSSPGSDGIFANMTLDVNVNLPRNTWIKHSNADIELKGKVRVQKQKGGELVLVGDIETERGWVAFQGRRFTVTQGHIALTGDTPINPLLNIVAQYELPDYEVKIIVGGSVQKPTLTLQSEPVLEQADILALLMFGKPMSQLGEGQKLNIQKQALDIVGGYAASQLAASISDALGLEELGFDLRQVDLAGGRVGFGRYVSPNTYVSVSQDVGGKGGREVTVEYNLSKQWKITTSSSANGNNAAGVVWQKQY